MRKFSALLGSLLAAALVLLTVNAASAIAPSAVISSGGWSAGLAHDDRYVYNSLLAQSQVIRIDPSTNQIVNTYDLPAGSQPYEMTIVNGYLYTANFWNMSSTALGTVSRIDLSSGQVTGAWATLSAGFKPEWITSNSTEIFVSGQSGKVARIPISTPSSVTELAPTYGWTSDIVVSGNYLYIAGADNTHGGVIRINLTNNQIDSQWALADTKIIGIAVGGDYIYAGKYLSKTVAKIRISDGQVMATSSATTSGAWLMTIAGGVIYSAQLNGDVSTFDATDLTLVGNPYATPLAGNMVYDAMPFLGALWVASYQPNNKVYRFDLAVAPTLSPQTQTTANPTVGSPFSTALFTATNFTSAVTYSVYPALPAGLTLNPATGQITGTPTGSNPVTTYTVTATGTDVLTATITFGVDSGAALASTGLDSARIAYFGTFAVMFIMLGGALVLRRRTSQSRE